MYIYIYIYIHLPPCICGTKWSDRISCGVPWRIELTSFKGPPELLEHARKASRLFFVQRFPLRSPACPFSDSGHPAGPKIISKSIRNGAQVHSQSLSEKKTHKIHPLYKFHPVFPKRPTCLNYSKQHRRMTFHSFRFTSKTHKQVLRYLSQNLPKSF
jgi:hypothetical protein